MLKESQTPVYGLKIKVSIIIVRQKFATEN